MISNSLSDKAIFLVLICLFSALDGSLSTPFPVTQARLNFARKQPSQAVGRLSARACCLFFT